LWRSSRFVLVDSISSRARSDSVMVSVLAYTSRLFLRGSRSFFTKKLKSREKDFSRLQVERLVWVLTRSPVYVGVRMIPAAETKSQLAGIDVFIHSAAFPTTPVLHFLVAYQRSATAPVDQTCLQKSKEPRGGSQFCLTDILPIRIVLAAFAMTTGPFGVRLLFYHCKITMVHGNLPSGHPLLGAIVTLAKVVSLSK
jgi:hypothetical protein